MHWYVATSELAPIMIIDDTLNVWSRLLMGKMASNQKIKWIKINIFFIRGKSQEIHFFPTKNYIFCLRVAKISFHRYGAMYLVESSRVRIV